MIEDECTLPNFVYVGPHKYFVETSKKALLEKMVEQKSSGLEDRINQSDVDMVKIKRRIVIAEAQDRIDKAKKYRA